MLIKESKNKLSFILSFFKNTKCNNILNFIKNKPTEEDK